jgi:hypothetical protein
LGADDRFNECEQLPKRQFGVAGDRCGHRGFLRLGQRAQRRADLLGATLETHRRRCAQRRVDVRGVPQLPPSVANVVEVIEYGHIRPDFLHDGFVSLAPPFPASRVRRNFFRETPVERYYLLAIAHRWFKKLQHDWNVGPGELDQPLANGFLRVGLTENDADQLVRLFVERAASFRKQGRDYTVVMVPRIFTVLATDIDDYSLHYYTRLAQRLNASGVHAVDVLEEFEAHDAKSLYFRTDGHWNSKGAALGAEVAATYLRDRGLVSASNN